MAKKHVSRWINQRILRGNKHFMVSSRCYIEHRYGWMLCIDWLFYILRGETNHCFNCYCLDVKEKQHDRGLGA